MKVIDVDWIGALSLPSELRSVLKEAFDDMVGLECESSLTASFPCPVYCSLGKRLYTALSVSELSADEINFNVNGENVSLADFVRMKYKRVVRSAQHVIVCLTGKPFGVYSFEGLHHPPKTTSEKVYLLAESTYAISEKSIVSKIEHLPVNLFRLKRLEEAGELVKEIRTIPSTNSLLNDLVSALTSKHANLGYCNYENFEFYGDAVIQLLLALTCDIDEQLRRKSNSFLENCATRLEPFLQDAAPTLNSPKSLIKRGRVHEDAKKIHADCLEAVIGVFHIHSGLKGALAAGRFFGVFPQTLLTNQTSEIKFAAFKLAMTKAVFQSNRCSVGELHLKRERLIGGRKIGTITIDFSLNLIELDGEIDKLAKNVE